MVREGFHILVTKANPSDPLYETYRLNALAACCHSRSVGEHVSKVLSVQDLQCVVAHLTENSGGVNNLPFAAASALAWLGISLQNHRLLVASGGFWALRKYAVSTDPYFAFNGVPQTFQLDQARPYFSLISAREVRAWIYGVGCVCMGG